MALFSQDRPNLIVTTDIGQDPDDEQSMVRLLHYANDFNILGIIANADKNESYEKNELRTDILHKMVDAYEKIYPNLLIHDLGYPTSYYLKSIIKEGCYQNGRKEPVESYIGLGKDTEGSEWIIKQVDQAKKPVHFAIWGGACDLAQALWKVEQTRNPKQRKAFTAKIRAYFIGLQDSSNQWILDNFPDVWVILALDTANNWESSYRGVFYGGNMQTTSLKWLNEHVINQNALADLYPTKAFTGGASKNPYGAMKEGDTPSFFYFLNNGLNVPENPELGGWGGRFVKERENLFLDTQDLDSSVPLKHARVSVYQWREDFQTDFATRIKWGSTAVFSEANHHPVISTKFEWYGNQLRIDAVQTSDPDGDNLIFEWFLYPFGSLSEKKKISEGPILQYFFDNPEETRRLFLRVRDTHGLATYVRF